MAIEDVRHELGIVREGAKEYGITIEAMADEAPYATLPDRALRVAELAIEMATLLEGIDGDAADFNYSSRELTRSTREQLGGRASAALAGSKDSATRYILRAVKSLDTGEYDPRAGYYADPISLSATARDMAQKASDMAARLMSDRKDISNVTEESIGHLVVAIDAYGQKL